MQDDEARARTERSQAREHVDVIRRARNELSRSLVDLLNQFETHGVIISDLRLVRHDSIGISLDRAQSRIVAVEIDARIPT